MTFGQHPSFQQCFAGIKQKTFKVLEQVYDLIVSQFFENDPKLPQIYFISEFDEQATTRNHNFSRLDNSSIDQL